MQDGNKMQKISKLIIKVRGGEKASQKEKQRNKHTHFLKFKFMQDGNKLQKISE